DGVRVGDYTARTTSTLQLVPSCFLHVAPLARSTRGCALCFILRRLLGPDTCLPSCCLVGVGSRGRRPATAVHSGPPCCLPHVARARSTCSCSAPRRGEAAVRV
ncbi:unnamed protein product, partial [Scytosiphon promiscuus]